MESNIGRLDRYVRLVTGLLALSSGSQLRRAPLTRTMLMSFGAMKIAEGVTGWCPVIQLAESVKLNTSAKHETAHATTHTESTNRRPAGSRSASHQASDADMARRHVDKHDMDNRHVADREMANRDSHRDEHLEDAKVQ